MNYSGSPGLTTCNTREQLDKVACMQARLAGSFPSVNPAPVLHVPDILELG